MSQQHQIDLAADCRIALSLGIDWMRAAHEDADDYRVVAVTLLLGDQRGARFWRLRFKRAQLLPGTPDDRVGAGGEILIDVDLDTRTATLAGYGE